MTITAIVCVLRSERSQRLYENQTSATVTITAIVCVLRSERSQRLYGNQTSAILTIAAIECFSAISTIPAIVTIVNDHMETRLKSKILCCILYHQTGLRADSNLLEVYMKRSLYPDLRRTPFQPHLQLSTPKQWLHLRCLLARLPRLARLAEFLLPCYFFSVNFLPFTCSICNSFVKTLSNCIKMFRAGASDPVQGLIC